MSWPVSPYTAEPRLRLCASLNGGSTAWVYRADVKTYSKCPYCLLARTSLILPVSFLDLRDASSAVYSIRFQHQTGLSTRLFVVGLGCSKRCKTEHPVDDSRHEAKVTKQKSCGQSFWLYFPNRVRCRCRQGYPAP